MRYLVGTVNYGLLFIKKEESFSFSGDITDRKSTSGYIFKLSGGLISWRSRKQSYIALSTAEAEYVSLTSAAQEAIQLSRLIAELQNDTAKSATVYEDNQVAICITSNPQFHGRSKHIAIQYDLIRDEVQKGNLNIQYCNTGGMVADMMTKGLFATCFTK